MSVEGSDRRVSIMQNARRGTLMNARKSIAPTGKASLWALGSIGGKKSAAGPTEILENTYRLEAKPEEKFMPTKFHKFLHDILEDHLHDQEYNARTCSQLALRMAETIREEAKDLNTPRYRFVCNVYIVQKGKGNVTFASRCLWHPDSADNYTEATYENNTIQAVATLYGIYFE